MMKKKASILHLKLVLGIGLGAYIGYSITNTGLGAIVGAVMGVYLTFKI